MRILLILSVALAASAGSSPAGDLIRRACLKAGRSGATPELCRCIQKVADSRLRRADQKLAASFFRDPHKAQVIRQSDRPAHEVFWNRYKAWGAAAEEDCGS
ncbi:MAG: hypothetical protein ACE5DK_02870 [Paracoccaceae bacterium]